MAKLSKNKYSLKGGNTKKFKIDWKIVIACLSSAVVVAGIYQFGVIQHVREQERKNTIAELTKSNQQYVHTYVLKKRIEQGNPITSADVEPALVSSAIVPSNYIKNAKQLDDSSLVLRMTLEPKTTITEDMIVKSDDKITSSTKNQDYDGEVISPNTFMKKGQYVDVHYKKKDGTDFIVASKKKVIDLQDKTFSLNITEKERDYINNAIVAASISKGKLYTTIYPDAENQPKADVTYTVDENIKNMIAKDPNIIKDAENTIKKENAKEENSSNEDSSKPDFAEGSSK